MRCRCCVADRHPLYDTIAIGLMRYYLPQVLQPLEMFSPYHLFSISPIVPKTLRHRSGEGLVLMIADDHCITDSCVTYSVMYLWIEGQGRVGERAFQPCGGLEYLTQVGFKLFAIFVSQGHISGCCGEGRRPEQRNMFLYAYLKDTHIFRLKYTNV